MDGLAELGITFTNVPDFFQRPFPAMHVRLNADDLKRRVVLDQLFDQLLVFRAGIEIIIDQLRIRIGLVRPLQRGFNNLRRPISFEPKAQTVGEGLAPDGFIHDIPAVNVRFELRNDGRNPLVQGFPCRSQDPTAPILDKPSC